MRQADLQKTAVRMTQIAHKNELHGSCTQFRTSASVGALSLYPAGVFCVVHILPCNTVTLCNKRELLAKLNN
jgi:hypothetical protein